METLIYFSIHLKTRNCKNGDDLIDNTNRNIFYILIALALFLGATVEYGYGSIIFGIILIAAAIYCLTSVQFGEVEPAMGLKWGVK